MQPSLRDLHDALLVLLGVLCAAYWFGNSGAGLALLWWESRRARAVLQGPPDLTWIDTLDDDRLTFAYVGVHRVVVIGERCGRREVFRDEMSAPAWVRLRRRCLGTGPPAGAGGGQPATGRSTSI